MDLSVITVTWNSALHITDQISSVFKNKGNLSVEQVVVDNGSRDATLNAVNEATKKILALKVISNNSNLGFSAANNRGAQMSDGDFLLFLNPDMQVNGNLEEWVNWMKRNPGVGISGCKLLSETGEFNKDAAPRHFPKFLDQLAIFLKLPHLFPIILGKYLYQDFDNTKEQEVDTVRGAAMLMRRELYDQLGWAFDPRYYIWFEDVDVCREAVSRGFKVVYTPIVSCTDKVGKSFGQRNLIWKQWNFFKSMVQYFWKWR